MTKLLRVEYNIVNPFPFFLFDVCLYLNKNCEIRQMKITIAKKQTESILQ